MAESEIFLSQLQNVLNKKAEWFNNVRLPEMLECYRILFSCTKNLYDALVKKSILTPDPYRMDKKIQEISIPDSSDFPEKDIPIVLGARFSEYEEMLDYLCTYVRFTVESFTIPYIKKLVDFNAVIQWNNVSSSCPDCNTRALASAISEAKKNTSPVIISMITDCVEKCDESIPKINRILSELSSFQRELYKAELRKDLFEHPEFNKETAYSSSEAEMAEIKRLYGKILGKRPFYTELIKEIIIEDQSNNKEIIQQKLLQSLKVVDEPKQEKAKKAEIDYKTMLMNTVITLSAISPSIAQLKLKMNSNLELLFREKKTFFKVLKAALRKVFGLKPPAKSCMLRITDSSTGSVREEKVYIDEFLTDMIKKERLFGVIAAKGPEYIKLENSSDDFILSFINKQITECQSLFTKLNAFDEYFKTGVDVMLASKVKGMQIELTAMRNTIINANRKRGEYVASVEESKQMKQLGISNDD